MPKIRTIFQPDDEVEVPDAEAEVARLQGLLHVCAAGCPHLAPSPSPAGSEPEAGKQAPAKAPAKTETPAATGEPTDQKG